MEAISRSLTIVVPRNVAFERKTAFNTAIAKCFEAFLRTGFGFHFRHFVMSYLFVLKLGN